MSASTTCSQSQALRIAVALVALRYKSTKQSYHSYVLDLQIRFPVPIVIGDNEQQWRQRALALEEDLRNLQEKFNSEQIELSVLRARSTEARTKPPASPSASGKRKQKKKVVKSPASDMIPTPTCLKFGSLTLTEHPLPEGALLTSFEHLTALLVEDSQESKTLSVAADKALDHLASLVSSVLSPSRLTTASHKVFQAVSSLLPQYLVSVLPAYATMKPPSEEIPSSLDRLLTRLMDSVIYPLIASFPTLSLAFLTIVASEANSPPLKATPQPRTVIDLRPHVLALLQTVADTLCQVSSASGGILASKIRDLLELMVLRATRELDCLYPELAPHHTHANLGEISLARPRSDSDRLLKLARKDSLWYFCNYIHLMFSALDSFEGGASSEPHRDEGSTLLGDAILVSLSALLRRTRCVAHQTIRSQKKQTKKDSTEMTLREHRIMDEVELDGSRGHLQMVMASCVVCSTSKDLCLLFLIGPALMLPDLYPNVPATFQD
ncbi:unnamed protein product [Somion occarium]|uniref:Uncharacterized protein n=1 Tax=Somion occarium TaxID=3059160 RepID=A0ABP1CT71_9APHY